MGVGASRRLSWGLRWTSARNIGYAWLMTVPICGILSAFVFWVLEKMNISVVKGTVNVLVEDFCT